MDIFEVKKKIVESGNSYIFDNWSKNCNISKKDFIEGLRWLCDDPCNGGTTGTRLTRELGCRLGIGLVKLRRVYDRYDICAFYDEDGKIWIGQPFGAAISMRDRI